MRSTRRVTGVRAQAATCAAFSCVHDTPGPLPKNLLFYYCQETVRMTQDAQQSNLSDWIGRQEVAQDFINPSHVRKIAASLETSAPAAGLALPPLWQWALFIEPAPQDQLGQDGHPKRGGFLPPADDRNRMWAGGRLQFHQPLLVGRDGERISTISAIREKQGTTGKLLFVTVTHEYKQDGQLCIHEEQDIVYREPAAPKLGGTEAAGAGAWSEPITPTSTLLFRYSAVTFNGHRIHYDHPYVTQTEGYPGLVVHGPMIATRLLQAFCQANPDKTVTGFSFRGHRPLIAPAEFRAQGVITEAGRARLWAEQEGTVAQTAEVTFK
jgi:itaconyl-CoA hydratase/mesaconyl-C4 CoA hydratase